MTSDARDRRELGRLEFWLAAGFQSGISGTEFDLRRFFICRVTFVALQVRYLSAENNSRDQSRDQRTSTSRTASPADSACESGSIEDMLYRYAVVNNGTTSLEHVEMAGGIRSRILVSARRRSYAE